MILSHRLNKLKPSPTLALSAQAKELKKQGYDVIDLCVGEPDFDTPPSAKNAGIKAIQEGHTKYTPVDGIPDLKKAIQQKFLKDQGLSYDLPQITISNGAKQVIFNALMATLDEGDEVIIPAPYWVSYPDMVTLLGGKPVIVPCDEDSGFKLTTKALESAITTKTKWVILNSPSNPTGAVYTKEELKAISQVLLKTSIWILSDDIYESLTYDGISFFNILEVEPTLKDRTVIVNGISKAYAMTGWRLGYAAGPKEVIQAMTTIQSQSSSNPSSISQYAAIEAITGDQSFLNEWRLIFQKRRDLALNLLNRVPGLSCLTPTGAFYLFVNCHGLLGLKTGEGLPLHTDQDVCQYLLKKGGVASVPGSAFGLSPYFRLSYAVDDNVLKEAVHRIEQAVRSLRIMPSTVAAS